MYRATRRHRSWFTLSLPGLLLVISLLVGAQTAYAYFWEAVSPPYPATLTGLNGCSPCSGSCSLTELENGNVCDVSSCACCGCEEYDGPLSYWNVTGATCVQIGDFGCACQGGDRVWGGTYTGRTARTVSDCG